MNKVQYKVVNGVATVQDKKKYVSPEIEVVNLDEQPKLLYISGGAGTQGLSNGGEWPEE
ncbi:MAG: hypothetical protein II852_12515 [Bacteroidales bacterium]|nr:hypothetical protein [Bacteroidales bacterium]